LSTRRHERSTAHRYGGEEFLVILPDTSSKSGCAPLERARAQMCATAIAGLPADTRVTVSTRVAEEVLETSHARQCGPVRSEGRGQGSRRVARCLRSD